LYYLNKQVVSEEKFFKSSIIEIVPICIFGKKLSNLHISQKNSKYTMYIKQFISITLQVQYQLILVQNVAVLVISGQLWLKLAKWFLRRRILK
jgi:hypothetical protein